MGRMLLVSNRLPVTVRAEAEGPAVHPSLGGLATADSLGIDDARVVVFERAPQLEAIKHSELVLCHGGCQTVHEALYYAKAVIAIPHHAEASEMANSVERNGAGIRISAAQIGGDALSSAVERVTGRAVRYRVGPRREGDPPGLVASSARAAQVLGWKPRTSSLDDIVASAYAWRTAHPRGYAR